MTPPKLLILNAAVGIQISTAKAQRKDRVLNSYCRFSVDGFAAEDQGPVAGPEPGWHHPDDSALSQRATGLVMNKECHW